MSNMIEHPKVGVHDFFIKPFHCDFSNHLRLDHFGNEMINAADLHSDKRGFGMNYLRTIGKTWVLSRFAIELLDLPKSYTTVKVETWIESAMRYFSRRNFAISDPESGNVFAYGRSIWAMIDTETRQPCDIFSLDNGCLNKYIDDEKPCPIDNCSRVKVNDDASLWRTITTGYSDIDVNGHVNSIKYMEHCLNLWNIDWYKSHKLKRVEMAYIAETMCGDQLHFYVSEQGNGLFGIKICTDKHEVCRCNITFI